MALKIPDEELEAILEVVNMRGEDLTTREILDALPTDVPLRTLQYRLKRLVETGRLEKVGAGRGTKYRRASSRTLPKDERTTSKRPRDDATSIPLTPAGIRIHEHLQKPETQREPVGYKRGFLDSYRPNKTAYLSERECNHLARVGRLSSQAQPGETLARHILDRLLIDLSWNSSRLEGNTYSLLDTSRLIEFGETADGKEQAEAQMILNHKDAIEFLVSGSEGIGFNRYTILNLHGMLANNLLQEPEAAGRLRRIPVGIERSTYLPLEVPQAIEECFDRILSVTDEIENPFEQAFFFMAQLPYLQPFDDVNKRVSRIAANIPFIRGNLSPLSFTDVPRELYTDALLGIYELNEVDLLKDVFIWAYERSAKKYVAVRQSLGDPDPFRLKHRDELRAAIAEVVRRCIPEKQVTSHFAVFAENHLDPSDRERFREAAERDLLGLHEGNFARYGITPSEFATWRRQWEAGTS